MDLPFTRTLMKLTAVRVYGTINSFPIVAYEETIFKSVNF